MTRKARWIPLVLILFSPAGGFPDMANKDKPRYGVWDFKLEKVWETDRAGGGILGRPQGIIVSDDGTLYLNDEANRKDWIFGPDGTCLGFFAPRGQGPGEVQRHGRFFLAGDKVIIPDLGRIHYFSRAGRYIATVPKDCEPHAFIDEHRLIDAPLSAVFLPEGKGKIVLRDLRSGLDKVLSEFSAFEGGIARDREATVDMIVPLFSPLMTIGYAAGRLYWGMSDRYLIHVTDLEGREVTAFSLNRRKTKVSEKQKSDYFRSGAMPADLLRQIVDGLPNELTCFHRIDVYNGLVFVFVTGIDLENKVLRIEQLDLFSPDGRYLYKARLNFGRNRIPIPSPLQNIVIKNGFLYAVLEDEKDGVWLAKYRIALPYGLGARTE